MAKAGSEQKNARCVTVHNQEMERERERGIHRERMKKKKKRTTFTC